MCMGPVIKVDMDIDGGDTSKIEFIDNLSKSGEVCTQSHSLDICILYGHYICIPQM